MFMRGGETVTIKRRSATSTDAHGNPTYTTTTIVVKGALVAVGGVSEPVDPARDAVDAKVTLYFPNGTFIDELDVFIVRGSQWVKDGSPQEWIAPFPTQFGGVIVPIRKRNG